MRAPISVIIPTLDAEDALPGCLSALAEGLEAELIRELIISDGGSSDETEAISRASGAIFVKGERGRGGQLARGANIAQGDWLLFLHADSWLGADWTASIFSHFATPSGAGVFPLAFRDGGAPGKLVAGWANFRTRTLGLPYGDQGLLIRRDHYDRIGGYPDIPLMEDVALAKALMHDFKILSPPIQTSAERYHREGWIRRSFKNFGLLVRYVFGVNPKELSRIYTKGR